MPASDFFGSSVGILPANAAQMAALRCPANYWKRFYFTTEMGHG
jgi:hypothetical protein